MRRHLMILAIAATAAAVLGQPRSAVEFFDTTGVDPVSKFGWSGTKNDGQFYIHTPSDSVSVKNGVTTVTGTLRATRLVGDGSGITNLPAGTIGPTGPQGPAGATGPAGPAGPKGDTGVAGPAGPAGPQGPKGDTGVAGPAGPKGDTGVAGPQGPKGDTGVAGPAGPAGPIGLAGPKGDTGVAGPAGPTGATGSAGPIGPPGATGSSGWIRASVITAGNLGGAAFSSTYSKVADIGTFTKSSASSTIQATFHGRLQILTLTTGNGARFELRIDDAATTNGYARALLRTGDAGAEGMHASMQGIFTGLAAGTHTVSMWVQGTGSGSGTGASIDSGNFSNAHVVINEFLP